jgi:hypothetical protein
MSEPTHVESSDSGSTPGTAATAPGASVGGGLRRAGSIALPALLVLFLSLGVVQIFLAGLGVFSLDGQQLGSPDETAFGLHRFVAILMSTVALLVVIAAAVARPGRRVVIMSVVLFLLVFVLQGVLAAAGEDTPIFGGLHAIFGIGSLGLAGSMLTAARAAGSPRGTRAAGPPRPSRR